jgi:hypothetical protein
MKSSVAQVNILGLGIYSQSRAHEAPKKNGESHEDYDKRTWKEHLHTKDGIVIIPETAIIQCIHSGVRYLGEKKKGMATWTKHFEGGIAMFEPAITNIQVKDVTYEDIYSNADGVRGSGKRVYRRFPIMAPWSAKFSVTVLDPEITEDVFVRHLEVAGKYRGIGRWRPEKGGQNGRFAIESIKWEDNRELIEIARK